MQDCKAGFAILTKKLEENAMNKILGEKLREAIALKKFSLIVPVINGFVKNQDEYFRKLSCKPIEMPHYGLKQYSVKTFKKWLYDYKRYGIDGLKPGYRSDRGRSRKISASISRAISKKLAENGRMPLKLIYEKMVENKEIDPNEISLSTFYRHASRLQINDLQETVPNNNSTEKILRYSFEKVNSCWQIDIMYGPYIHYGRSKKQTYLIGIIDDASRLIVNSAFYHKQTYETLRHCLKEAILKRGIPEIIYTDNGKIFKNQQFEYLCAETGISLIHSRPFIPRGRGKIERYFRTVRSRFLSSLDSRELGSLDELNEKYSNWLLQDYQNKKHSSIGSSPLDFFLKQLENVKMVSNPKWLDEVFMLKTKRKVSHDATIQIDKILYETQQHLKGLTVEVRYEPEWISKSNNPLLLYIDGKKVGTAYRVDFNANAKVARGILEEQNSKSNDAPEYSLKYLPQNDLENEYSQSISFTKMMGGSDK